MTNITVVACFFIIRLLFYYYNISRGGGFCHEINVKNKIKINK